MFYIIATIWHTILYICDTSIFHFFLFDERMKEMCEKDESNFFLLYFGQTSKQTLKKQFFVSFYIFICDTLITHLFLFDERIKEMWWERRIEFLSPFIWPNFEANFKKTILLYMMNVWKRCVRKLPYTQKKSWVTHIYFIHDKKTVGK